MTEILVENNEQNQSIMIKIIVELNSRKQFAFTDTYFPNNVLLFLGTI